MSKPAKSDVPKLRYAQSKAAAAAECDPADSTPPEVLASDITPRALGIGVSQEKSQIFTVVFSDPCGVDRAYTDQARLDGSNPDTFDLYFIEYDDNGNEVWAVQTLAGPYGLHNSMAGTWTSTITGSDGRDNQGTVGGPRFYLQRWSRVSNNASPEPVAKGATITVTGALTRANWNDLRYHGYANRPVKLAFRTTTGSYGTVKTITTSSTGKLRTTVKATRDGCFRFELAGTTTTPAVKGAGDCVDVR